MEFRTPVTITLAPFAIEPRERMLPGPGRAAEQIAVRHPPAGKCAGKPPLDRVVAQKAGKVHDPAFLSRKILRLNIIV